MKDITFDELLALFDADQHDRLRAMHATGDLVVFENMMMDSSQFGSRSAVIVGPGRTFPSVEWCEDKWLNDLPSQRQHARYVCRRQADQATVEK